MTREQKIELLDYIATQIKKLDIQSISTKDEFDSSTSFMQKVDCIANLKYIEGQLHALTNLMTDLNLKSKFHEETFSLN